jgi:hypothetical protein
MNYQLMLAPLRPLADIVGIAENYYRPDLKNTSQLSNRITNNLLYYQTNYGLFLLTKFFLIWYTF